MLNASIEGKNVNEILFRIQDCASKKITEVDLDVQRARGKAAILNIKQSNGSFFKFDLCTSNKLHKHILNSNVGQQILLLLE